LDQRDDRNHDIYSHFSVEVNVKTSDDIT